MQGAGLHRRASRAVHDGGALPPAGPVVWTGSREVAEFEGGAVPGLRRGVRRTGQSLGPVGCIINRGPALTLPVMTSPRRGWRRPASTSGSPWNSVDHPDHQP